MRQWVIVALNDQTCEGSVLGPYKSLKGCIRVADRLLSAGRYTECHYREVFLRAEVGGGLSVFDRGGKLWRPI